MATTSINNNLNRENKTNGDNRIEMLLFRLTNSTQLYGVNVFKVREVLSCPKLTVIPSSHAAIRGIANFRGKAIPVIDFSFAIGNTAVTNLDNALVIMSESAIFFNIFFSAGVSITKSHREHFF